MQTKKFTKLKNYEAEREKRKDRKQKSENEKANMGNVEDKISTLNKNVEKRYVVNKQKVRKRAIAFSRLPKSRKNFYFFTITFPAGLTDDLCFKVLNIALTRLRKENILQDYLWITERQKNQTLHYHLLTNDIIKVSDFNSFVRSSLRSLLRRKEFTYDKNAINNYNGVDIMKNRKTRKVINLAKQKDSRLIVSYLTKYITKNNEQFTRLPFHSSHSLSHLTNKILIDQYTADCIWHQYQQQNINPKTFKTDFCTLYFFSNDIDEEIFKMIDERNIEAYESIKQPARYTPHYT